MKLKHPDTDLVIETDEDRADTYLSQGWAEAPARKPRAEKPDES